jgi:hypothetical protein
VLVLESRPRDRSWSPLCASLGVRLSWAPDFPALDHIHKGERRHDRWIP